MKSIAEACWEITICSIDDRKYFWEAHAKDNIGIAHEHTAQKTYKRKGNAVKNAAEFLKMNNITNYTISEE